MESKARLDLRDYDGLDRYSDGAIEDEVLARLEAGETPLSILRSGNEWPLLYHLSPERWNLLSWYAFRRGARLLEIGAGWGALTGLFLERGLEVTAVELSEKRSRINWLRHRRSDALRIAVGAFEAMRFDADFECVTLIGVLEYAAHFGMGEQPYNALLRRAADCLLPGGTLWIAIENPFGMQYFAGAPEDHAGRPFVSVEGYAPGKAEDEPAKTFSKRELTRMIEAVGLSVADCYYPMPDYKLPGCVVHASADDLFAQACLPSNRFAEATWRGFDETRALIHSAHSGLFGVFANSFLIAARKESPA